jgi:hypothetical protein
MLASGKLLMVTFGSLVIPLNRSASSFPKIAIYSCSGLFSNSLYAFNTGEGKSLISKVTLSGTKFFFLYKAKKTDY